MDHLLSKEKDVQYNTFKSEFLFSFERAKTFSNCSLKTE